MALLTARRPEIENVIDFRALLREEDHFSVYSEVDILEVHNDKRGK